MKPLRTGLAPAVTAAVFYSLGKSTDVAFSGQFMGFMDALFHGMDFLKRATTEAYDRLWFFRALIVMSLWAFALAAFFAFIQDALLGRERRAQGIQHE